MKQLEEEIAVPIYHPNQQIIRERTSDKDFRVIMVEDFYKFLKETKSNSSLLAEAKERVGKLSGWMVSDGLNDGGERILKSEVLDILTEMGK